MLNLPSLILFTSFVKLDTVFYEVECCLISFRKMPIVDPLVKMESSLYLYSFPRMRRKSPVGRKPKRKYFWIQTVKKSLRRTLSRSLSVYLSKGFSLLQMYFMRTRLYELSFRKFYLRKEPYFMPTLHLRCYHQRSPLSSWPPGPRVWVAPVFPSILFSLLSPFFQLRRTLGLLTCHVHSMPD